MNNSTDKRRWIAHVDLDAFFASCEQRDRPEYRQRPVVVGAMPGHRGVVAAASYEARKFGIRSAMPISEAYRRCPNAVFLRPDMEKYRQASRQVMQILAGITPVAEAASIDEAYLDVGGLGKLIGPPQQIGHEIRRRILAGTRLTASVGIGPNRLIAKLASESCKPDGLKVVPAAQMLDFLAPLPVSDLRGLGRATQKIFARLGIATVAQLRAVPLSRLEQHLGPRAAASFHRQAFGISSAEVVPDRSRKSISKETTFETDIRDADALRDTLRELCASVAEQARGKHLFGAIVTLKIRFRGFETHTRKMKLAEPTNDERTILKTAWSLFRHGNLPRKPVRLIGVGIRDWSKGTPAQSDLFEKAERRTQDQQILMTIDNVKEKFGPDMLRIGMTRKPPD
ncbi:MAG: DNA polymerase IV [Gammaproteobacteria bacterium]